MTHVENKSGCGWYKFAGKSELVSGPQLQDSDYFRKESDLIFGLTWPQIKTKQQGGK